MRPHSQPFHSLRVKITAPMLVGSMIGVVTLGVMTAAVFWDMAQEELHNQARLISHAIEYAAEADLDAKELRRVVNSLGAEDHVEQIVVVCWDPPSIIASTHNFQNGASPEVLPPEVLEEMSLGLNDHKQGDTRIKIVNGNVDALNPILLTGREQGHVPGHVWLRLNASQLLSVAWSNTLLITITVATGLSLAFGFLWFLVSLLILQPLSRIAKKISDGDIDQGIDPGNNDEIGILVDTLNCAISSCRNAEYELQVKSEELHAIISSTPGLIYRCDVNKGSVIQFMSDGAMETLGYPAEEFIGEGADVRTYASIVHPDDVDFVENQVQFAVIHDRPFDIYYRILHATKGTRWVHERGQVVNGLSGERALIGFVIDATRQKEAEQALDLAMLKAEQANKAKSEFLANMSHEIRTPLSAILGYTDLLNEEDVQIMSPEKRHDALTTIKRNGEHLLAVINDILDLSKIEAGKLTVESISCSPFELVDEVLSLMRIRAEEKDLHLESIYETPVPEVILSDPTRVRQILVNLMGNAIKFTSSGSIRLYIRYLDDEKPQLEIDVVDTGIGMTANQASKLFQPFVQADSSTTRNFGGTGLGLAISKRLSEMLGGDITIVESILGKGTRFRLTIETGSLSNAPLLTSDQFEISHHQQASTPASVSSTKLDGQSILLAEDGIDNQKLISMILRKAGAEVSVVETGLMAVESAMEALSSGQPFDVILMDMQMPVLDGYTATTQLRESGYTGPIIALTANSMSGDREACLAAGCDDFSTKPIDRAELISMINSYTHEDHLPVA